MHSDKTTRSDHKQLNMSIKVSPMLEVEMENDWGRIFFLLSMFGTSFCWHFISFPRHQTWRRKTFYHFSQCEPNGTVAAAVCLRA